MNLKRGSSLGVTWRMGIGAAGALVCLAGCSGLLPQNGAPAASPTQAAIKPKPAQHAKATPKAEPTQADLYAYVRGKLLSLSPSDGVNDNQEIAFNPDTSVLSITQPDGRCDISLGAIDANTAIWEVFDPSDNLNQRENVLRLTFTSISGKRARVCYDAHNQVNTAMAGNRARFLFSQRKASAVPDFTDKMGKAMKKLVLMAGGSADKDPI